MERERLASIVGGRASKYVDLKKPSELIPFRGRFPLLEPYQVPLYKKAIRDTKYVEELSEEFQKVTEKGNRIALLEEGFLDYLTDYNISKGDFLKMNNSEKSNKLINWLNKDCIDFTQLTIK